MALQHLILLSGVIMLNWARMVGAARLRILGNR